MKDVRYRKQGDKCALNVPPNVPPNPIQVLLRAHLSTGPFSFDSAPPIAPSIADDLGRTARPQSFSPIPAPEKIFALPYCGTAGSRLLSVHGPAPWTQRVALLRRRLLIEAVPATVRASAPTPASGVKASGLKGRLDQIEPRHVLSPDTCGLPGRFRKDLDCCSRNPRRTPWRRRPCRVVRRDASERRGSWR